MFFLVYAFMYVSWYRLDGVITQKINNQCRDNLINYTMIFIGDEEFCVLGYITL
jgi:hypothetical protein